MAELNFIELKKGVDTLLSKIKKVRQNAENRRREREELALAPPLRTDALDALNQMIDLKGAQFRDRILFPALGPVLHSDRIGNLDVNILTAHPHNGAASPKTVELALYAIMGAEIKGAVAKAVEAMPWPENAVSMTERDALLAGLDKQISELETQEAELLAQAAAAGIAIS